MLAPVALKLLPPTVPLSVPQNALPLAMHDGVPLKVTPLGKLSVTATALGSEGPKSVV